MLTIHVCYLHCVSKSQRRAKTTLPREITCSLQRDASEVPGLTHFQSSYVNYSSARYGANIDWERHVNLRGFGFQGSALKERWLGSSWRVSRTCQF